MHLTKKIFGCLPNGQKAQLFKMSNTNGMEVSITNYGGTITKMLIPDRNEKQGDVVLGFDKLESYLGIHPNIGGIVGRYANRIANGICSIEGERYQLTQNEFPNTLHGGKVGFDKKLWDAECTKYDDKLELKLFYLSEDGEEGFPGNLSCEVIFTLFEENRLRIHYRCTTDRATIVNLTHHDYFNLKDGGVSSALDHQLLINANQILQTDGLNIPTGKFIDVENTIHDFRSMKNIGSAIDLGELEYGFDQNYVLHRNHALPNATLCDPSSGRKMEIYTTQPGLQLYTAGYLSKDIIGKNGVNYGPFHGICLEGQHFPDSPNHPHFPETLLKPNDVYEHSYDLSFSLAS